MKNNPKHIREIIGLLFIFMGLLITISLWSYNVNDPTFNHSLSSVKNIHNSAGTFGSYVSGFLVEIFGLASYVWALFFLFMGLGWVTKWLLLKWYQLVGYVILSACFVSFAEATGLRINDVAGGGWLGALMHAVTYKYFNPIGSVLIWIFFLVVGLELCFKISWIQLFNDIYTKIVASAHNFQEKSAQYKEARKKKQIERQTRREEAQALAEKRCEEKMSGRGEQDEQGEQNWQSEQSELSEQNWQAKQSEQREQEDEQNIKPLFFHSLFDKARSLFSTGFNTKGADREALSSSFEEAENTDKAGKVDTKEKIERLSFYDDFSFEEDFLPSSTDNANTRNNPNNTINDYNADNIHYHDSEQNKYSNVEQSQRFSYKEESRNISPKSSAEFSAASSMASSVTPSAASLVASSAEFSPKSTTEYPDYAINASKESSEQDFSGSFSYNSYDNYEFEDKNSQNSSPVYNSYEEPSSFTEKSSHDFSEQDPYSFKENSNYNNALSNSSQSSLSHNAIKKAYDFYDDDEEEEIDIPLGLRTSFGQDFEQDLEQDFKQDIKQDVDQSIKLNQEAKRGFNQESKKNLEQNLNQSIKQAFSESKDFQLYDDSDLPSLTKQVNAERAQQEQIATQQQLQRRQQAQAGTQQGYWARVVEEEKNKLKDNTVLPTIELLSPAGSEEEKPDMQMLEAKGERLIQCLADFKVLSKLAGVIPGPVVTMFEIRPDRGVQARHFEKFSKDIAMAIKAVAVRVQAPIPGTDTVGIEVPNTRREIVNFRNILASDSFRNSNSVMSLGLGKDIFGSPVSVKLEEMPHLLVAGSTGAGKSVCLNSIILSILYKAKPSQVKMLLIDPKRVELAMYADLPHLVHPVVTDMDLAKNALLWAIDEMDQRYQLFQDMRVRNFTEYNAYVKKQANRNPVEADLSQDFEELFDEEQGRSKRRTRVSELKEMPYIVIIVDELADLMMQKGKEVEASIVRLAQLARAAGIHLIIATQRPSVDVVTGLIKANFPSRIAFQVTSGMDSRTILDTVGAEALLGKGDMLFKPRAGALRRMHGAFVTDDDVNSVVDFWKAQQQPEYSVDFTKYGPQATEEAFSRNQEDDLDPMYDTIVERVLEMEEVSISMLQRNFKLGFGRAGRIVDQLERNGIVGPSTGSKPRKVIK